MDRQQLAKQHGEWLSQQIWNAPKGQLRGLEGSLPDLFAAAGLTLSEVLGETPDESLVLAVQKDFLVGECFEVLLEKRYKPLLVRWFVSWGRLPEDPLDLAQVILLKLWQTKFGQYAPQADKSDNFRGYLWTMAHNLRVQVLRHKSPGVLEGNEPSANGQGPVEEAISRELAENLESALAALPPDQRRVLCETMNDRKMSDIMVEMDRSRDAGYMLLFRARRNIEKALGLDSSDSSQSEF